MKIKFKHQQFQADAAKAVVDVFKGQPYLTPTYLMDRGLSNTTQRALDIDYTGWSNHKIVPSLTPDQILANIQKIQRDNLIKPSEKLEGKGGYNLTIEMETGVGKTYTYIKTMYELHKAYGWSKYIVVVPSIAIREGVYKSFQMTQDHFAEEYGTKIKFFIYNSAQLTKIEEFASDSSINVMIINSQAFNATGKDARRITMELDEFRSRKPIDIIASTNPILIIDEPQSVEGAKTKQGLEKFKPLMTLRYSATHKADSIYNMIYRLDAMDAYNQKLVKKIAVKGISVDGETATQGYVYLESINISKEAPTASISFDVKGKSNIRKVTRILREKDNLYDKSGELEEYKNDFVISHIDGRDNSVEFLNGIKMYAGEVIGHVDEDEKRRIQIRETINSHIERERDLFSRGIKVLSLFFIDEVAKYRQYNDAGEAINGEYAQIFEEEYNNIVSDMKYTLYEADYKQYLETISPSSTHSGYFSIDKKGKMIDYKGGRRETTSDDVDAYDLIMKNKELLLDRDPKRSPVRFIFSHSALREGWDNPNVFQICTLKQSSSDVRKRQEVGRGLRLCVNENGERMDVNNLGNDVHNVNLLTVIASESYDNFAKGLQSELAEAIGDRPTKVTEELFIGREITKNNEEKAIIDKDTAIAIHEELVHQDYIYRGELTDKYYEDIKSGNFVLPDEFKDIAEGIKNILNSIYDPRKLLPENTRENNVDINPNIENMARKEFKALWAQINSKSVYTVSFETQELVTKAISAINEKLFVGKLTYTITHGKMTDTITKEEVEAGTSFEVQESGRPYVYESTINNNIKYDLIGELAKKTNLTRKTIANILRNIRKDKFDMFKDNPEEFILKVGNIINTEKGTAVIEHITYNKIDDKFDENEIFTKNTIKVKLDKKVVTTEKHIYDHLKYDSNIEKDFAKALDKSTEVAVYAKLPSGFYISTPLGKYNPDWAIAFDEKATNIKHIYFVAETKGKMESPEFRQIEKDKIVCAKKHFEAISEGNVKYHVVNTFEKLMEIVRR